MKPHFRGAIMAQSTLQSSSLSDQEICSLETFYRAFSDGNAHLLDEACTPDWQDIPLLPGQGPGTNGMKKLLPMFLAAFPDMKIVVHEIVGSAGRAGVRASITGTHRGEIFGVAPTSQSIDVALHEFHHLQSGKITHTWHLEDWFGMLNRLGAWPPANSGS
jgi:predicted ester cyclase